MELRDYLAGAALIMSAVSIVFSFTTYRFNRRAKVAELRGNVLAKAAEILGQLNNLNELNQGLLLHANEIGDRDGAELFGLSEAAQMKARFDRIYARLSAAPMHRGLDVYESFYHEFLTLREDTQRLEQRTQQSHDRYLAIRELPSGRA